MFKKTSDLKNFLDSRFSDVWMEYEPETITAELEKIGTIHSPELTDKIELLISLEKNPGLIDDGLFFLHAVDVLNGNRANFDYLPHPVSLELAWAIEELKKIFGEAAPLLLHSHAIKSVITYLLIHEGFKSPTKYLREYAYPSELSGEDEPDKEKAITLYLKGMNDGKPD